MIGFSKSTTVPRYFFASTMFSMLFLNSTGAVDDAETVRTGVLSNSSADFGRLTYTLVG